MLGQRTIETWARKRGLGLRWGKGMESYIKNMWIKIELRKSHKWQELEETGKARAWTEKCYWVSGNSTWSAFWASIDLA